MMGVVVDDVDAVYLPLVLKASVCPGEGSQSRMDHFIRKSEQICQSDGSEGVQNIVVSVYPQGKFSLSAVLTGQDKRRKAGFVVGDL